MARRSRSGGRGRASNRPSYSRGPTVNMAVAPPPRRLSRSMQRILKGASPVRKEWLKYEPKKPVNLRAGGIGGTPARHTRMLSRVRYGKVPVPGTWKIDRPGRRSILVVPRGHILERYREGYGSLRQVLYGPVKEPRFPADRFIVCVRREQRRQIMHAIGRAGSGQPKQRTPQRSAYSNVEC